MVQITLAVGNKVSTESSFCPAQAREADVTYLLMKVNKNEILYVNNLYENDTGVSFPKSQDTDICSVNRVLFLSSTAREADVMFLLVKVNKNEMMCKYLV